MKRPVILFPLLALLYLPLHGQKAHLLRPPRRNSGVADTSYIYELPFPVGKRHYLIQGYNGIFSHQGDNALDFTMKQGTPVLAARDGVVTEIKEDGEKHGFKEPAMYDGNYIEVRHSDGTYAGYWHLQKNGVLVNVGDTVHVGQQIGLSGHTGYSSMPHLHFYVYGYDTNGNYMTYPTRFRVNGKIRYLRAPRFYYHDSLLLTVPFLHIPPTCGGYGGMGNTGE